MKRLIALCLCLPIFCAASSAAGQSNSAASANPQTAAAGSLQLTPVKELRKGVVAWPLIVNPGTPAETRVNATLTKLNLVLAQSLRECDATLQDSLKGMPAKDKADAIAEDWSRKVRLTMAGPRFLSLVATDETDCGGAHPNSDGIAMVFDMTTGKPVNWLDMLPNAAQASAFADFVEDGSKVGALVLPALQQINIALASDDCKDAFPDPQSFLIWPDAQQGRLVARAFDLIHVTQGCAMEISLTIEQARKLGFDESLLSAIEQAHLKIADKTKP